MKRTPIALWLLACLTVTAGAQTDAPPVSPGAAKPASVTRNLFSGWTQIEITSAGPLSVDLRSNLFVYQKDVVVKTPSGQITCDYLVGRARDLNHTTFDSITAETNVVLDAVRRNGEKLHGTGSRLVYTNFVSDGVTNEWIELTGDPYPVVSGMQFTNTGEAFIYDLRNERLSVKTPHIHAVINRGGTNAPAATQAPPPAESPNPSSSPPGP